MHLNDPIGSNTFRPWTGHQIAGVSHPRNIEQLWTADELSAVGLWRDDMIAAADAVPSGKYVVSTSVQRVSGVVKFVNELEDIPPPPEPKPTDFPLRPDQFYAMLDIANLTDTVSAVIAAIPNEIERKIAKAKFERTPVFYRDHPLFAALKAGVGLTDAQIDAMWMQAKDF